MAPASSGCRPTWPLHGSPARRKRTGGGRDCRSRDGGTPPWRKAPDACHGQATSRRRCRPSRRSNDRAATRRPCASRRSPTGAAPACGRAAGPRGRYARRRSRDTGARHRRPARRKDAGRDRPARGGFRGSRPTSGRPAGRRREGSTAGHGSGMASPRGRRARRRDRPTRRRRTRRARRAPNRRHAWDGARRANSAAGGPPRPRMRAGRPRCGWKTAPADSRRCRGRCPRPAPLPSPGAVHRLRRRRRSGRSIRRPAARGRRRGDPPAATKASRNPPSPV